MEELNRNRHKQSPQNLHHKLPKTSNYASCPVGRTGPEVGRDMERVGESERDAHHMEREGADDSPLIVGQISSSIF